MENSVSYPTSSWTSSVARVPPTSPRATSTTPPTSAVSLFLIVRIYKWFGISFGGIRIQSKKHKQSRDWFSLIWSIICFVLTITTLVVHTLVVSSTPAYYEILGDSNAIKSKPILELLINSVVHLYALDNLISFAYFSFISGHVLISHLSDQSILIGCDVDRKLGILLLAGTCVVTLFVNVLMTVLNACENMFDMELVNSYHNVGKIVGRRVMLLVMNGATQVQTILFVYVAVVYRRQLRRVKDGCGKCIDITQLVNLKHTLSTLSSHYQLTIRYFQFPLLFTLLSCTSILIGSVCMLLMVTPSTNSSTSNCKRGFISYLIVQCTIRLMVLIYYGDTVHFEANKVLWSIRNRIASSNRDELGGMVSWLIKRRFNSIESQFECRIYSLVTIRQALVIGIGNFVLSYTVLLIQTDYSDGGSISNGTINIT